MRALISVSDKQGVVELAKALGELGVEILSTGGTAAALASAGVAVKQVSEETGAPEILDGRVKTLHPKIHGALLGRPTDAHRTQMKVHGIGAIDLVVVNLYPFQATIAKPGVTFEEAIENIDIGGPAMLRSAAKNHERVAVVVDPADYPAIVEELRAHRAIPVARRLQLARKAFAHTAAYDAAIAAYLSSVDDAVAGAPAVAPARRELPDTLGVQWRRLYDLRYGENPHQRAAFYADAASPLTAAAPDRPTIAAAEVLGGKQLSYNNILDLDAALGLCLEFTEPAAIVVKHNNPCGVAVDREVAAAYRRAREADATSAFGGIVAVNREVDEALAKLLVETFLECVVAPGYAPAARDVLAGKKNLRLVAAHGAWRAPAAEPAAWSIRTIAGGALVQTVDGRRARRPRVRVAGRQARQVERDRVREGRRDARDRRRPDEPGRFGADLRAQGGRQARRLGGRVRRVLPVPRRRRRARPGRRARRGPARRLGARRGGHRGGRRARPRDAAHRDAPLPPLSI